MKQLTMNDLFNKLNDLKTLFQFGQKIIPILQNLIDFMQDTIPLLENINRSIAESTSKIPKASNQINNVTSATELATTEILDLVDSISGKMYDMEAKLNSYIEKIKQDKQNVEKLKELAKDNSELLKFIEENFVVDTAVLEEIAANFPSIQNDAYSITLSLQVQDITSQQLAAVNHLIESVQENLAKLIDDFETTQMDELEHLAKIDVPEGATFDPNARYDKSGERQEMADEIINQVQDNLNTQVDQSEIDKLFSK